MRMCHRFDFRSSRPAGTSERPRGPRLRIAMVCAHSNPLGPLGRRDTGGMSVYIREMSRALASLGHMVDLFVGEPLDGPTFLDNEESKETLQRYFGPNVHWVSVPCSTKAPHNPSELIKTTKSFHQAILRASQDQAVWTKTLPAAFEHHLKHTGNAKTKQRPFDVIFSHYWLSGLAGLATAHSLHLPHVIMFHTLAHSKAEALGRTVDSSCRVCAEHLVASQSHGVLAPTDSEKEALMTHYGVSPSRIAVVPCGVDGCLFRPKDRLSARRQLQLPLDALVYLFVGRLDPIKGLERLFDAFARLPRSIPARLLVVGGDVSEEKSLEAFRKMVEAHGLSRRVIFAGRVEQARLPDFYAAADALVIASHYESFCLVALEALASGTPVVGPPVGVLPEVLSRPEAGVLLRDNSPEELLRGLTAIAKDRSGTDARHVAVRRDISLRYSWNRVAQDLAQALSDLIYPDGIFKDERETGFNGLHRCSRYCSASGRS
ncbi:MAG: glycosyltransferase [Desulfosoma sp.]